MREGTSLKALQLMERYIFANTASHDPHMLIYVAEATLYIAFKLDESSCSVSFADFHVALQDFPAFLFLLRQLNVPSH
jgi:hypothetical protein